MVTRKLLLLAAAILVAGCVCTNESSTTANKEQIRDRIAAQLHCKTLELVADGNNRFSGTGQNDSGGFTITLTREDGKILFHGVYVQPAGGTFSGSASWDQHATAGFGFHKTKVVENRSVGTP